MPQECKKKGSGVSDDLPFLGEIFIHVFYQVLAKISEPQEQFNKIPFKNS